MKQLILTLMLAVAAQAQFVNRVVEFTPDGTDTVNRLIATLQISDVSMKADTTLGLLNIVAKEEAKLDQAEALFRKYYKPRPVQKPVERNIELNVTMILGKTAAGTTEVSPAMAPVVQQLKQATTLKTFTEVESQVVRTRSGQKVETAGQMLWEQLPNNAAPVYQMAADVYATPTTIQVQNLRFGARIPYKHSESTVLNREMSIGSSFDLKPGQTVVVGKSNVSSQDGALILVVTARLVD